MDRIARLLCHVDLSAPGIEVAPYFNPAIAKRDGHPVLTLDVFGADALRDQAAKNPNIPPERISEIEEVDIVADASSIGEAITRIGRAGQFGYIVSSHNFEHLPDPIRFLQGCSVALAPGGVVSMAVPDGRACFDHFRMPTRLGDWLSAHHRQLDQPAPETIFDFRTNSANFYRDGTASPGCDIRTDDPSGFLPKNDLRAAYAEYLARLAAPAEYKDAHCTVTFGAALENMIADLRFLGLIDLEVIEITETVGLEFFVHLRKPIVASVLEDSVFYAAREQRQRRIAGSLGSAGFGRHGWQRGTPDTPRVSLADAVKAALFDMVPAETRKQVRDIRAWNKSRKTPGKS